MPTKLAVFDFDGTIAMHGVVPSEIIDGFAHLQSLGYATTISTGRGYVRLKEGLGDDFEAIVSPDALLILEHGAKITDRDGNIIFQSKFSADEIDHILDFARRNSDIFRLIWFALPDPEAKVQVWCANAAEVEAETEARSSYADVFTGPFSMVREKLLSGPISNISLKLKPHIAVHNLKLHFAHTESDMIFQDGNLEFLRNNANKALAVEYVLHHLGLKLTDLLVAGNAINDVEMLDLGAADAIFVGSPETHRYISTYLTEPENLQRVDAPEALGLKLQSFE